MAWKINTETGEEEWEEEEGVEKPAESATALNLTHLFPDGPGDDDDDDEDYDEPVAAATGQVFDSYDEGGWTMYRAPGSSGADWAGPVEVRRTSDQTLTDDEAAQRSVAKLAWQLQQQQAGVADAQAANAPQEYVDAWVQTYSSGGKGPLHGDLREAVGKDPNGTPAVAGPPTTATPANPLGPQGPIPANDVGEAYEDAGWVTFREPNTTEWKIMTSDEWYGRLPSLTTHARAYPTGAVGAKKLDPATRIRA